MVNVLGLPGPYRDAVDAALRFRGFDGDPVVIVGLPTEAPRPDKRYVVALLPGEPAPPYAWLRMPNVTWLVSSPSEISPLLNSHDEALRIGVLPWSCTEFIVREPTHDPEDLYCVARGRAARIPGRLARLGVPGEDDIDLWVLPSTLSDLLRAQHQGIPVVVADDSPLAWYVEDGVDGIVCPLEEVNARVEALLENREQMAAMTVAQPSRYIARWSAFEQTLAAYVLGSRRRVVFAHGQKPNIDPRTSRGGARGLRYQALQSFGYSVSHVPELHELDNQPHDFVFLGGRVPADRVRAVKAFTHKPIVMAMNDAILEMSDRVEWFKAVAQYADLIFTGEPPEGLPDVPCRVVQLHQAPFNLYSPQRGTVRPPFVDRGSPTLGMVFLANHWYPRRRKLIESIASHGCVLHLFGRNVPNIEGTISSSCVAGPDYVATMRNACAVLSTSICNDREITSVRLFEAAAVGAYVIAESFPGCREIYPDDCVDWFDTPEEAAALGLTAMEDPESDRIVEMRRRAQAYTWRCYSALDRMSFMLGEIEWMLAELEE